MHAISEGTVFIFYTSLALNALFIGYIAVDFTDKPRSK